MATRLVSRIRNAFEASDFFVPAIHTLTQNRIYQKLIYNKALKKITKVEKEKRFGLALEVSSFCNARCIFCPNKKMVRKKSVMNMVIFKTLLERLKKEGIRLSYVNLTGTGEPLTDKTLFEKIRLLKLYFPDVYIFMPTNFALATEEMIKKILESDLDRVTISLNANRADEYKTIMGLNFKRTLKNIDNLIKWKNRLKKGLSIMVTIAASRINKVSVNDFVRKWEARVDAVAVNWVHTWAGAVGEVGNSYRWARRYPCKTLFEQIVVQSNGDVVMCCVDYEGKVVGGNVMKNKILDAFLAGRIGIIKKLHKDCKVSDIKMCSQCRFSERGTDWLV